MRENPRVPHETYNKRHIPIHRRPQSQIMSLSMAQITPLEMKELRERNRSIDASKYTKTRPQTARHGRKPRAENTAADCRNLHSKLCGLLTGTTGEHQPAPPPRPPAVDQTSWKHRRKESAPIKEEGCTRKECSPPASAQLWPPGSCRKKPLTKTHEFFSIGTQHTNDTKPKRVSAMPPSRAVSANTYKNYTKSLPPNHQEYGKITDISKPTDISIDEI